MSTPATDARSFPPEQIIGIFQRGVQALREEAERCAQLNQALDPEWVQTRCEMMLRSLQPILREDV